MKNRTFASTNPSRARRRRRGTSRLFVLGAAFMASTAVSGKLTTPVYAQGTLRDARIVTSTVRIGSSAIGAVDEGQATQTATFDIPAGPIGAVADQFRTVTGIRVVFANEDIKDLPSPGVSGVMTAEQALERLLVGTGVGYVFTARDLVTMDITDLRVRRGLRSRDPDGLVAEVHDAAARRAADDRADSARDDRTAGRHDAE